MGITQTAILLTGKKIHTRTDYAPLKWMATNKKYKGRITRWFLALQDFNFTTEHPWEAERRRGRAIQAGGDPVDDRSDPQFARTLIKTFYFCLAVFPLLNLTRRIQRWGTVEGGFLQLCCLHDVPRLLGGRKKEKRNGECQKGKKEGESLP